VSSHVIFADLQNQSNGSAETGAASAAPVQKA